MKDQNTVLVGEKAMITDGEFSGVIGKVIAYDSVLDNVELKVNEYTVVSIKASCITQGLNLCWPVDNAGDDRRSVETKYGCNPNCPYMLFLKDLANLMGSK